MNNTFQQRKHIISFINDSRAKILIKSTAGNSAYFRIRLTLGMIGQARSILRIDKLEQTVFLNTR